MGIDAIQIKIIGAPGLPYVQSFRGRETPKAFVKLKVESSRFKTKVIEKTLSPAWNEVFELVQTQTDSTIRLSVIHDGLLQKVIGSYDSDLATILKLQEDGQDLVLSLKDPRKGTDAGKLHIQVIQVLAQSVAQEKLEGAIKAHVLPQVPVLSVTIPAGLGQTMGIILSNIDVLVRFMDKVAEIHPLANCAWQVLSSVYNAIKDQLDRDNKINLLIFKMQEMYGFVESIANIPKHPPFTTTVVEILKQTVECAYFIQTYAQHNFIGRVMRQPFHDWDTKISEFASSFTRLHSRFNTNVAVGTAMTSLRISNQVQDLWRDQMLIRTPPDMDTSSRPRCLPGTRTDDIKYIVDWITSTTLPNVLWVKGVAGSGKSTLSTTIADLYRAINRLGSFIFFTRENKTKSDPSLVIKTLASKLAAFDARIGDRVTDALRYNNDIVNASLSTQFDKFILETVNDPSLAQEGPILIIIDALDECGDPEGRKALLSVLTNGLVKLPPFIRILITSRRELDIERSFQYRDDIHSHEFDTETASIKNDIISLINHRLGEIRTKHHLASDWPGSKRQIELAERAGGLFIWASTACEFIGGYAPEKRLKLLLEVSPSLRDLDQLYRTALLEAGDWTMGDFREDSRVILGLILAAKVPLTCHSIDLLLIDPDTPSSQVLSHFNSVLRWSETQPIRTLHASFPDFLTDPERSGNDPWFINLDVHNHALAEHCIRFLDRELKENMCGFVLNTDMFEATLSEALSYASTYWIEHLCAIGTVSPTLGHEVYGFLTRHFLHWVESLTLLRRSRQSSNLIQQLLTWCSTRFPSHKDLRRLLHDAFRFSQTFAEQIEQHPLLIYRTALPFTPTDTTLFQLFSSPRFPHIAGNKNSWTPLVRSITTHVDPVECVSISPDGTLIASTETGRKFIRVWDVATGNEAIPRLLGHKGTVTSVAFSPLSSKIVSGSNDKTIRIWDAKTGVETRLPLSGHTDVVTTVAFSSDEQKIVSGSKDRTVRVWNVGTGQDVVILSGHQKSVTSVAFSPDGTKVVSGGKDHIIYLWDISTGKPALPPLIGHSHWVTSVAYSPDGSTIASCSDDTTIRLWSAYTGKQMGNPLEGHTSWVISVAFSPDGSKIVSASYGSTIKIWDVLSGQCISTLRDHLGPVLSVEFSSDGKIVSGSADSTIGIWDVESATTVQPLPGHRGPVISAAISPDKSKVVSCSSDTTLRIWDTFTGAESSATPLVGHRETVTCVAFSPDGTRIVSGAYDCTVRVWDVITGEQVLSPLRGHYGIITCVTFSPCGTLIASTSSDGTTRLWNSITGACAYAFQAPKQGSWIISTRFSADGSKIISKPFQEDVLIWDVNSAESLPLETRTATTSPEEIYEILSSGWISHRTKGTFLTRVPRDVQPDRLAECEGMVVFPTIDHRVLIVHFPD